MDGGHRPALDDKTFCVYLAKDEAIIQRHAKMSGFPATKITQVKRLFDPTTAYAAACRGGIDREALCGNRPCRRCLGAALRHRGRA
ncbi:DUF4242 domain-containing protein [Mesorhizobium sp. B2-7-1]|nr:DUF4242 domain-containing protein [Mesorhizobium sp. B2-7-1]